jgi:uncharacterized protein
VDAYLRGLAGGAPLETHISAVYVGADTVWKLRKAVCLPFLDFRPLAERRRTALREVELNAPSAPGMYRDAAPVVRTAAGLALGGDGEPLDWVVRMAHVPAADFLDEIAARKALTPDLLDQLADAVAALHARLGPADRDWPAALIGVVEGNAASARKAGLADARVRAWRDAALALVAHRLPWLADRAQAGFVRRCHGDLHLGNVCLWQGRPVPFDALEFDEGLATIDVGYDLAFLLMDLEHRAGRAEANRVLNRYLARSGDWGLVAGLPLFLSLRAMVRAHVEASRGHPAEAEAYLRTALDRLRPALPVVVAIGGLPASGKSTLARALAPGLGAAPGAVILRSDEIRKRQHGAAPGTKLPPSAYTEAASGRVFAELFAAVAGIAAAGHAVIADATFLDLGYRASVQQAAGRVPFVGAWLQAGLGVLEARIAARSGDASDADLAVLRRAAPSDPGPRGWTALDATDAAGALAALRAAIGPVS